MKITKTIQITVVPAEGQEKYWNESEAEKAIETFMRIKNMHGYQLNQFQFEFSNVDNSTNN